MRGAPELAEGTGPHYESVNAAKLHRKLVRERQGISYEDIFATVLSRMPLEDRARLQGLLDVGGWMPLPRCLRGAHRGVTQIRVKGVPVVRGNSGRMWLPCGDVIADGCYCSRRDGGVLGWGLCPACRW